MTPRQRAIVAALRRQGGWMTADQLRAAVAPGTSRANMRVQVFRLREQHGDRVRILSSHASRSGGYKLVEAAERAGSRIP